MESEIICKARNGKKIQLVSCFPNSDNPDCKKCNSPNKKASQKQKPSSAPTSMSISNNRKYGKRSRPSLKNYGQFPVYTRDYLHWLAEQIFLLENKTYAIKHEALNLSEDELESRLKHFNFLDKLILQGFDIQGYNVRRPQFYVKDFEHLLDELKNKKTKIAKSEIAFLAVMEILNNYKEPGRMSSIGSFTEVYDSTSEQDTLFTAVENAVRDIIFRGAKENPSLEAHLLEKGVSLIGKKSNKPAWWLTFDRQIKFTTINLFEIGYTEKKASEIMASLLKFDHPEVFKDLQPEAIKAKYKEIKNNPHLKDLIFSPSSTPILQINPDLKN